MLGIETRTLTTLRIRVGSNLQSSKARAKDSEVMNKERKGAAFAGLSVALVTPFSETGAVDYDTMRAQIEFQIAAVDGLELLAIVFGQ